MNISIKKTIAVFGSSAVSQDSAAAEQAYRLGYALAQCGFTLCNGGYMGIMEAASRGAAEAKGEVVGVTCSALARRSPNSYLTREILTPDLPERIATLMRIADAYIVLDGNIGTLAELFLAWNLAVIGWTKPLIVVGDSMRQALLALQPYTEIQEKQFAYLTFLPSVDAAVALLCRYYEIPIPPHQKVGQD